MWRNFRRPLSEEKNVLNVMLVCLVKLTLSLRKYRRMSMESIIANVSTFSHYNRRAMRHEHRNTQTSCHDDSFICHEETANAMLAQAFGGYTIFICHFHMLCMFCSTLTCVGFGLIRFRKRKYVTFHRSVQVHLVEWRLNPSAPPMPDTKDETCAPRSSRY